MPHLIYDELSGTKSWQNASNNCIIPAIMRNPLLEIPLNPFENCLVRYLKTLMKNLYEITYLGLLVWSLFSNMRSLMFLF